MTTTSLIRNYELGIDSLYNSVYNCFVDEISDEEADKYVNEIISEVNYNLPEDIVWEPYSSELIGPVDADIDMETFNELLEDVFETVIGY